MGISFKQIAIFLGLILFLTACKPSDKYAGEWYALSNEGEVQVNFSEYNVLTVTDDSGHEDTFEFNQTETGFK